MAIDITQETLYTLTEAAKLLKRVNGRKVAISTLWRWCSRGIHGVHLDHVRIGRRICTSAEALSRFANALAQEARTRLAAPNAYRPLGGTRAQRAQPINVTAKGDRALRARQLREADEILARAGI